MNRPFLIPMRADAPVHSFGGQVCTLTRVRRFHDDVEVTEWLRGEPITVVRVRTEDHVPVPLTAGDMADLEALLSGGLR